jgi:hypothetical protein
MLEHLLGGLMTGFFISPNWHVVLLHLPLALLTVGTFIELFAFLWRGSSARVAARWMILLGALGMIPVATSGIYAFANVATGATNMTTGGGGAWSDIVARSRWGTEQWWLMKMHIILTCSALGLILLVCVVYLGGTDRLRAATHLLFLLFLVVGVGTMLAGARYSGEAVYRYGVAVTPPAGTDLPVGSELAGGEEEPAAAADQAESENHAAPETPSPLWNRTLRQILPPLQVHTFLAGLVIALAVWGVGTMFRKWSVQPKPSAIELATPLIRDVRSGAITPGGRPDMAGAAGLPPRGMAPVPMPPPVIIVGGLFLLAFVLALLTAATGLWFTEQGNWRLESMRTIFTHWIAKKDIDTDANRMAIHAILGVGIVVLSVALAIIARVTRRARIVPLLVLLLFLAAVGLQVWVGVLMLYGLKPGWL